MLMVDTELRPSSIHGLGVFLLSPVRKGDLVWKFDARIDRVYSEDEIASLPDHVQHYLRTYSTWHEDTRLYVLCGDNGRFFNHSENPTTVSDGISFGGDRAARDLSAGEELTSDYKTICDHVRRNGAEF
jgi:SET domain-containing protein